MLRTLYARLSLALFILFIMVGCVFFVSALYSAHMYQQEVAQRLNRSLAMYIVDEHVLIEDGVINQNDLERLFRSVMIINPSLELYLLGPAGDVLAYSAAPEKVVREKVSLAPIRDMLGGEKEMPVLGDDPRSLTRSKAFSVAPIDKDGRQQGYIYAVLGSEQVDYIGELLQHSYIMRLSAGGIVVAMLFAFAGGLTIFFLLTRRMRRLSQAMQLFRQGDYKNAIQLQQKNSRFPDEVDEMSHTFNEMALHIRKQMEKLRDTDALRRELVANVSHDLRTPLASLKGYIETLLLKDESLTAAERRTYLEVARDNSDRLSRLVMELFELAKLDANEIKPHRESFSLSELVHDVMQKFQLQIDQKSITVEIDAVPDVPYVEADIGMIERVLDNLVDNAIRHTQPGGVIHLSLAPGEDRVSLRVSDSGAGIAKEDLPRIFQRFYRKNRDDETQPGAGLGLAIAQRIVELHGSKLEVDSELHKGTVFGFCLPTHLDLSA